MGRLTDILGNGNGDRLRQAWDETEAANELSPLLPGEYVAHVIAGDLETGRTRGTPGYKLTFKVCEGEYIGRQFWHDIWLTEAALPMAKRDLAKLGVTSLDQLEQPLPRGIRCSCKVVLRRDDDGNEYNKVRTFAVVAIDEPEADAFAPDDEPPTDDADAETAAQFERENPIDGTSEEAEVKTTTPFSGGRP